MGDRTPEVNTGKCITCFCCQEICPSRAIALR
jgi:formate hydrogenlyase subunit 6/NADH:ubiquinone oxidoreductase subunit I